MKPKVLIAIISNKEADNSKFKLNANGIVVEAKKVVDAELTTFGAPYIEQMRNDAADYAVKHDFTHLMELDTDMLYPVNSVELLLKHDKDFVTGSTRQRKPPFLPMHYKEIYEDSRFQAIENRMFMNGTGKLVQVGASSICGALINTDVLRRIGYPYFKNIFDSERHALRLGEDMYFCKRLFESGIDMFVDPTVKYSHRIDAWIDDVGILSYWGGKPYRIKMQAANNG